MYAPPIGSAVALFVRSRLSAATLGGLKIRAEGRI